MATRSPEEGNDEINQLLQEYEQLVVTASPKKVRWIVTEDYPENMRLGTNVRNIDKAHYLRIGMNMWALGQLQECVGDLREGETWVHAGQHRYLGFLVGNEFAVKHGLERKKLRVRVSQEPLTKEQILAIQIAENLQLRMPPEKKADAIWQVWLLYKDAYAGEKIHVSDYAKLIGRTRTEVADALKYVGGLAPEVHYLVENDMLSYSIAVDIAKLKIEKQAAAANHIVQANFTPQVAHQYILGRMEKSKTNTDEFGLFAGKPIAVSLERDNHRIAIQTAADRAANYASGYFQKVLHLARQLPDPERLEFTRGVEQMLCRFINSADGFRHDLNQINEPLELRLEERAQKLA